MIIDHATLVHNFVVESNKIEGINRPPTTQELDTFELFLKLPRIEIADLKNFVNVYQPGAIIRDHVGLDVYVGNHHPPRGGSDIVIDLHAILREANSGVHPYKIHNRYETLHPFMDGNGRSGRAIWAWQMVHAAIWPGLKLGFLHAWYYQSLEFSR